MEQDVLSSRKLWEVRACYNKGPINNTLKKFLKYIIPLETFSGHFVICVLCHYNLKVSNNKLKPFVVWPLLCSAEFHEGDTFMQWSSQDEVSGDWAYLPTGPH